MQRKEIDLFRTCRSDSKLNFTSNLNMVQNYWQFFFKKKLLPAVDRMDGPKGGIEKCEIRN